MAKIVEFRAAQRPRSRGETNASAEIVFFPGVRYERWDGPQATHNARTRNRDTLELVD